MKKTDLFEKINNTNSIGEIEKENSIKTTNVNILLNRVRLNQKKDFKRKLILFFIFAVTISSFIFLVTL